MSENFHEEGSKKMSRNSVRTMVALVAAAAMSLVGAGQATAASVPTASGTVAGYQVKTSALTYTFTHEQSVALYEAGKAGGAGAVGVLCARYAGALAGVACSVLATYIIDTLTDPPAAGECYQVYSRLGVPPFGARVVSC